MNEQRKSQVLAVDNLLLDGNFRDIENGYNGSNFDLMSQQGRDPQVIRQEYDFSHNVPY